MINEWSSNPDLGVATDWIVNFPTKGFHVDQFCNLIQANNNRWRYEGASRERLHCLLKLHQQSLVPAAVCECG